MIDIIDAKLPAYLSIDVEVAEYIIPIYPLEYPLATYLCTGIPTSSACLLLAPTTNATRDELLSNGTTPALR